MDKDKSFGEILQESFNNQDKERNFTPKKLAFQFKTVLNLEEINELIENFNNDAKLHDNYISDIVGVSNYKLNKLTKALNKNKITTTVLNNKSDRTFTYGKYIVSGDWLVEEYEDNKYHLVIDHYEYDTVVDLTSEEFEQLNNNYKPSPDDSLDTNEILLIVPLDWFIKNSSKIKSQNKINNIIVKICIIPIIIFSLLYFQL